MQYIRKEKIENISFIQDSEKFLHLDMELTERCNLACIHCFINQPEIDEGIEANEMTTEFVKDILDQAADLGCLSVRFTGGEPLLRRDFSEIFIYARKLGLKVILLTNATRITPRLCQIFQKIPPGRPIEVTVYGMKPSSYDVIASRPGAYSDFMKGIDLLRKYHIPFVVKQSLLPQNRSEIDEFEAFAATIPSMDHKPIYTVNFDLRGRRDNPKKNLMIKKLRFSAEESLSFLTRDPESYLKDKRIFARNFMGKLPKDKLFNCGAGFNLCVDAYGRAQMCLLLRHPDTIYPLDKDLHYHNHPESKLKPLEYAIKVFFPQVRKWRAKNSEYLDRCAKCFLHGLCEQCPAKSWEEHGTLDTPVEYLCDIAHHQAEYLGLLAKNEKAWQIPEQISKKRLHSFIEG